MTRNEENSNINNLLYGVISANFAFYFNNYLNKAFLKFKLSSRNKILLLSPFSFIPYYLFMGISEKKAFPEI